MAHREALHTIRAARAGHAAAQLELGKNYLFGAAGLPKNSASALYWLDRAAQQQEQDAWVLIGSYIPFETASMATNVHTLCFWYQRAFEAGVLQAGIVYTKLVLAHAELLNDAGKCNFCLHVLRIAARAGLGEAQWLWAQHRRGKLFDFSYSAQGQVTEHSHEAEDESWQQWAERAALNGVEAARHALEDDAWNRQDYISYLKWALIPARAIMQAAAHSPRVAGTLSERERCLLKRCALALEATRRASEQERQAYWEVAAHAGDAQAQFTLGLRLAKMDSSGRRVSVGAGRVIYKRALRWLQAAAQQGMADACYVISKIYCKPEFSHRDGALARENLQQAAQAGHGQAQLEWGLHLWRMRSADNQEGAEGLYWLLKAAENGNQEAKDWIARLASPGSPPAWARQASEQLSPETVRLFPFLAARIELALHFGLSRAEALLLNFSQADRGHCLVIDIRHYHPRSKRRLIAIQNAETQKLMSRLRHLFHEVDGSENGPEGNYRRRLYRLKSLMKKSATSVRAVPGVISRSRLQTPSPQGPSS